jgi:hypothetical protein
VARQRRTAAAEAVGIDVAARKRVSARKKVDEGRLPLRTVARCPYGYSTREREGGEE